MFKCSVLALLVAVAACGDNRLPELPPEFSSSNITMRVDENGALEIDASATDPAGRPLTYTASMPEHGTVSGTAPHFVYTPEPGYVGTDTFVVRVSNGVMWIDIPVIIHVESTNHAPVPLAETVGTPMDTPVSFTLHATDDGTELTFEVVTMPAHGALTGTPPELTYTPETGYHGPDALTFRVFDGVFTSGDATLTLAVTMCGDGSHDAGEACDDGNNTDGDGCSHSCLLEGCGDGLVQFALGESCDDGNHADGDGCDATCHVEPFETVAPVKISGDLTCTTSVANAARKIALDPSGTVYAVMQCGTAADVVVSTDRGVTYSEPHDLSVDLPDAPVTVSQVAVAGGPSGTAYVGIMLNTGKVYLRTTQDKGATWSDAVEVGTAASTSAGLSLQSFNDDVYVGFSKSGGVQVARNHHRGAGAFDITPVDMSIVYFDLVYDITLGTLAVVADTPTFHIRASSDGGATFAAEVNPAGSEFYSDWTIGNGKIYVSGTSGGNAANVYVISTTDLTTATPVGGLPVVTAAQTRSLAADAAGNAFVASQLNAGGVQLDRLAHGADAFDTPRAISATGGSPVPAPLPGNQGAALIYTDGTAVYATIQVYTTPPP